MWKSVTPGQKILTLLEGMFKAIADLQSATAMLSLEIEFGNVSQCMTYRFDFPQTKIRVYVLDSLDNPEKVRGRYRCVLSKTNQRVLKKFSKGHRVIVETM
jgi:hypothetical protein